MELQKIHTENAPEAIGPYSQAILYENTVYCSGQIPLDPVTGEVVKGEIDEQTKQVLKNLSAVLQASGADISTVVRTEVYLANMDDYKSMNEVYAEIFHFDPSPARVAVEVSRLPKDVLVEISCIAHKK